MVIRSQGFISRRSGLALASLVIASVAIPFQSNAAVPQLAGNAVLTSSSAEPSSQSRVAGLDGDTLPGVMHHYP